MFGVLHPAFPGLPLPHCLLLLQETSTCPFHTVALETHTLKFDVKVKKKKITRMYFEIIPLVKLVSQHFALSISAVFTCSALVLSCLAFKVVPIALRYFKCELCACLWWVLALGPSWGCLGCSHCPAVCNEQMSCAGACLLGVGTAWGFSLCLGQGPCLGYRSCWEHGLLSVLCRLFSTGQAGKLLRFYVTEVVRL